MKFHIIIPTYNNKEDTLKCLKLLSLQSFQNIFIYVVDTNSQDGTVDSVLNQFPATILIKESDDLWWTGAVNAGLREALAQAKKSDYILTLNNDVDFNRDYLENLLVAAKLRPGYIIGSTSIDKYDKNIIDTGVYFDWRTRRRIKGIFRPGRFFNDYVNRLPGRGSLIPVTVFRQIGLYDERRLPHYAADSELAVRAQNYGMKVCIYYGAILVNDTKVSGYKYTPLTKLKVTEAKEILLSNRSVTQIRTRLNFTLLCCPKRYLLWNLTCELFTIVQVLTSIVPLWHIKIFFKSAGDFISKKVK
jgi:GT2 family glycosyltransferase